MPAQDEAPPNLTRDDVIKVAMLARLALSDTELSSLTEELSKIVGFVSQLSELNTDEVEPLAHPLDSQNVFREDRPVPSLSTADALRCAPRHDEECFLVPAVLGESGSA
ncbi:MAG: Asp-tRNA(Asn)/Glu-tRNA(Gln) amidotransferase subunit GatC [Pirellulales bacterium]|jgi:aspartyl-tRNA(Asn)/glutamyl-tRNA(Gln) amidotransferase subunit C